jgi:uncharacterized membrane protein
LAVLPAVTLAAVMELKRSVQDLSKRLDRLSDTAVREREPMPGVTDTRLPSVAPIPSTTHAAQPVVPVVAIPPPLPPALPQPSASSAGIPPIRTPGSGRPEDAASPEGAPPKSGPSREALAPSREILRKGLNWILFGEDERPVNVSTEFVLARTWLPRLAVLLFVLGAGWFLKYSIEQDLMRPEFRVAIGVAAGVALLVWGMRLQRGRYDLIGLGLLGAGLLILYFAMYAAATREHVFPVPVAFALMAVVTAIAGVLSVRTGSLLVALVGVAGGYLTPVLLRTAEPNLPGLYAYLLLIGLGIVGIAMWRQWRMLHLAAFVGTYGLFAGSLSVYAREDFVVAMPFLTAYFLIHSAVVYVHNLHRRTASTVLDILHLAGNAFAFAGFGYGLIADAYGRPYPAILAVGLCAFYTAHVVVFLRSRLVDRPLVLSLIALAGASAVWALPLLLEKETLTIALALLALMFVWIGVRLDANFLQQLSFAIYAVVAFRLLTLDMPRQYGGPTPSIPFGEFVGLLVQRLWQFGLPILSLAAAFVVQSRARPGSERVAVGPVNDSAPLLSRAGGAAVLMWAAILMAFVYLHLEIGAAFRYFDPLRLPMLTALWCGAAVAFLVACGRGGSLWPWGVAATLFVVGAAVKLLAVDWAAWRITPEFTYGGDYRALPAVMRLLDYGVLLFTLGIGWRTWGRRPDTRQVGMVFGWAALALLLAYITLEVNSFCYRVVPAFRRGGVSVAWAFFAVGLIVPGLARDLRALRVVGLALLAVVAVKVFLHDLERMQMLYRVIAALAIGALMLGGAFAYVRASRLFGPAAAGEESRSGDGQAEERTPGKY